MNAIIDPLSKEYNDVRYTDMFSYSDGESTATASLRVHTATELSIGDMKKLHRIMKTQLFGYCKGVRQVNVAIRWDDTFYVDANKNILYNYIEDESFVIIGNLN